jgi:hypothetical protein
MKKDEEIEKLLVTIDECVQFLKFWKVNIAHRVESAEDAFVAITELERECRVRLNYLTDDDDDDIIPF